MAQQTVGTMIHSNHPLHHVMTSGQLPRRGGVRLLEERYQSRYHLLVPQVHQGLGGVIGGRGSRITERRQKNRAELGRRPALQGPNRLGA
jgi:hypothetical protein